MLYERLKKIECYINQDQESVCISGSSHILIEGVAGSRKTDTMIRLGLRRFIREDKNLLFLTQIGSVTDEIKKRIEDYIGCEVQKQGGSNHYLFRGEKATIEISNFDAWIHHQLTDCQVENLSSIGSFHQYKVKLLYEFCLNRPSLIKGFVLKNGELADEILIDECQDFEENKALLLLEMLKLYPNVRSVFAGDRMQTLFEHSIRGTHPIDIIYRLHPSRFHLTTCFRCPRAHLLFTNRILERSLKKYDCQKMRSVSRNDWDKPFLFTHGSVSRIYDAHQVAQQCIEMLGILCQENSSIQPSDVCFIMRKCNDQKVFEFLKKYLELFWGIPDSVIHFSTQQDGFRTPIQWEKALNKTCLLSIHGDKGKGHKVVFFLGLTQGSIPEECAIHKKRELVFDSLLNVALTRSTQYLFIGFHGARPSQYLCLPEIKELAYCSWDQIPDNAPKVYRSISKRLFFQPPIFEEKPMRPHEIIVPALWPSALPDLLRNFERVEDLLGFHPKMTITVFGKKCKTPPTLPHYWLSKLTQILLWKSVSPDSFFSHIGSWFSFPVLFTQNEKFVCLVKDLDLNLLLGTPLYKEKLSETQDESHKNMLDSLFKRPTFVLSSWLEPYYEMIKQIVNKKTVPLDGWIWLVYYFLEMNGEYCSSFVLPKEFKLERYIKNIQAFSSMLNKDIVMNPCHDLRSFIFDETRLKGLGFTKEHDPLIYKKGFSFGITASSDIFDIQNKTLYLLKHGCLDFSREWILMASLCSFFPIKGHEQFPTEKVCVVNFSSGKIASWDKPLISPAILDKLLPEFPSNLHEILLSLLSRRLKVFLKN